MAEVEDVKKKKSILRRRILKERDFISQEKRQIWNGQILERLIRCDEEKPCGAYLCYVNYKSEVSTKEFIRWCLQKGKAVFVPKVLAREMEFYRIFRLEDLKASQLGILEPEGLPEHSFSAWMAKRRENHVLLIRMLMPGAVFDREGNRIGYGGGYYDRWLARWEDEWENGKSGETEKLEKIGIAYKMQIVEEIPAEPFDKKADFVMTNCHSQPYEIQ